MSRLTAPPVDVAAAASTRCIALISDEIDCMSVGTSAPTLGAKCISTAASRSVVQFQRGTIATWDRPEAHELLPMGRDAREGVYYIETPISFQWITFSSHEMFP